MADNITVKDADGNDVVLATSESGSVHTTKHLIVQPSTVVNGQKAVTTAGTAEALGSATTL